MQINLYFDLFYSFTLRAQPFRHFVAAGRAAVVAGRSALSRAGVGWGHGIDGRGGLAWRGRTAVIASVSGINGRTAAVVTGIAGVDRRAAVVAGIAGIGGRTRVGRRAAVPCAGL